MVQFVNTTKQIVGVSVTPGLGIEVAVLDKKSPVVLKYGRRYIEYNVATREIQDYAAFKAAIVELFRELDINLKSSVYLTLPNVHLDFESLPLIIGDEAINNAILSKAEDSYIFKRVEPVSAWCDLMTSSQTDKRLIVYSSFQESTVSQIKDVFLELGIGLVGIESSYSATIRGIYFSDAIGLDKEDDKNINWNLLLVNSNSYALFSLKGTRLIDYTEVPLAIKSFSTEEAYQAIATSVSQVLPNFPAKKLFILSQADDICAEVLKTQITFDEEIIVHDCNRYSKVPPINISASVVENEAAAMTYALIGALASDHMEEKILDLNLLAKSAALGDAYFVFEVFEKIIPVTQDLVRKILIGVVVFLAVLCGVIYGIFYLINTQTDKQISDYQTKINSTQQSIESIMGQGGVVDIETLITNIIESNKKAINFYDSISTDIPPSLWLQYYYNKNGDRVAIEGISANIADIYDYYKSLKVVSPQSDIKLNKLQIMAEINGDDFDIAAPDLGSKYYEFEISNVNSPRNKDSNADNADKKPNQQQGNANGLLPLGSADNTAPAAKLEPVDINN